MQQLTPIQMLVVWVPPVLLAITVHEVAHGWVASRLGDKTALMMGRLTLNPIKHIDPVGTILVPALLYVTGGMLFGWAKPVPVTWQNLRNPRRDVAYVALAGPLSNLAMLIIWAVLIKIAVGLGAGLAWLAEPLVYMGWAGVMINCVLMVLNLLPIPPLDGSRVLAAMLPPKWAWYFSRMEPYGIILVLLLFFTGILGQILNPLLSGILGLVGANLGL